jgi:adenine-specific DNA methylase
VRMFSFTGDTVLDPFMGTGTTLVASARCGRNAIGIDVEPTYARMARERMEKDLGAVFRPVRPAVGHHNVEVAGWIEPTTAVAAEANSELAV